MTDNKFGQFLWEFNQSIKNTLIKFSNILEITEFDLI